MVGNLVFLWCVSDVFSQDFFFGLHVPSNIFHGSFLSCDILSQTLRIQTY